MCIGLGMCDVLILCCGRRVWGTQRTTVWMNYYSFTISYVVTVSRTHPDHLATRSGLTHVSPPDPLRFRLPRYPLQRLRREFSRVKFFFSFKREELIMVCLRAIVPVLSLGSALAYTILPTTTIAGEQINWTLTKVNKPDKFELLFEDKKSG